jgi:multiple sugar transport system substrate-binding protein
VVIIDSPESVSGLRTERSMIEDGVAPQAVVNYKEPETAQAFLLSIRFVMPVLSAR